MSGGSRRPPFDLMEIILNEEGVESYLPGNRSNVERERERERERGRGTGHQLSTQVRVLVWFF